MQKRDALRDDQWEKVKDTLPGKPGRTSKDNRLFIEAVMWIGKTGAPWRDTKSHCYSNFRLYCLLNGGQNAG